jgi:carboxymethylenebutenolidase
MPHFRSLSDEVVERDIAASIAALRARTGGEQQRLFSVGFCYGGRLSFNLAASEHGFAGVIGFYGQVLARDDGDQHAPLRLAPRYRCPVLGLFGGADAGIPVSAVEEFRSTLEANAVSHEIAVYDGAPHSFFDRTCEQHREACDDAWRRVLGFVGRAA